MRLVLVDNYDSFTFNLLQQLATLNGEAPLLVRNDERVSWASLRAQGYRGIVVSPGPGRPDRARDFGVSAAAIKSGLPVLGVCLGHQGLCHLHGARVVPAPAPVHGCLSEIRHVGEDLFAGIPSPLRAVRYHSLAVEGLPRHLHPLAWADDDVLMAVRHADLPLWGVQFHPESICSEHGDALLANFCALASEATARRRPAAPAAEPAPLSICTRELRLACDPETVFADLYRGSDTAFWLDSSAHRDGRARFSFMGDGEGPLAELITYDVSTRRVTTRSAAGVAYADGPLLDHLAQLLAARRMPSDPALPFPFVGGWVGYLGYELKAELCGAAAHAAATPDAALLFADRFLTFDHARDTIWLVAIEGRGRSAAGWLADTEAALRALPRRRACMPPPPVEPRRHDDVLAADDGASWPPGFRPRHSPVQYAELIARCQEAIRLGESYEVCLTNMVTVATPVDAWETYVRLRAINPAPYAAYLRLAGVDVLSASPERFLAIDAAGRVEAKPIKGTAPRGASVEEDLRIRERLHASEKDRAENLMIVDLLRNDLGAVCEVGSVHVPTLFGVESFATVHQLVSTIRGRIGGGASALDVVRAAFPGGSMTGAPKKRTMELVDELEAGPRGVYSGALGWLGLDGSADLSVVIRTLTIADEVASFGVGGAIVALSDPLEELQEARLKARALMQALVPRTAPKAATA